MHDIIARLTHSRMGEVYATVGSSRAPAKGAVAFFLGESGYLSPVNYTSGVRRVEVHPRLGSRRSSVAVTVNAMTDQVMGSDGVASHCVPVTLLGLNIINEGSFLPRVPTNAPTFSYQPSLKGRMGIFAVTTGDVTRAWIVLLPESGVPDRAMVAISPSIGQAADYYAHLGASN